MLMDIFVKSKRSSRITVLAVSAAIPLLAIYNWIVAPHSTYLHAAENYEVVMSDVAKQNSVIKSRTQLTEKELEKIKQNFGKTREKFFTPEAARQFLSDIEVIATQTSCLVYSVNYIADQTTQNTSAVKSPSPVTNQTAVISLAGSYDNIINFFTQLFDRPQLISIKSIDIKPVGRNFNQLDCDVTVTVYIIQNEEIITND